MISTIKSMFINITAIVSYNISAHVSLQNLCFSRNSSLYKTYSWKQEISRLSNPQNRIGGM